MTKEEFKLNIVFDKMGLCPTEECFEGMWEMWKYLHKPINEDNLEAITLSEIDSIMLKYAEYGDKTANDMANGFYDGFKEGYRKVMEE